MKLNRFIPGFLTASLIFGGTAFAVSVNNTPSGGYLLCGNPKTKDVTFPGTLKCPSGTIPIEVPGSGQYSGDGEPNTATPTKTTANSKDYPDCNLTFILKNSSQVNQIIDKCSGNQLTQLISDLNKYDVEAEKQIQIERDKLNALKNKETASKGTAAAQEAADAVTAQAQIVSDYVAKTQSRIAILTAVVSAISKKVKAG